MEKNNYLLCDSILKEAITSAIDKNNATYGFGSIIELGLRAYGIFGGERITFLEDIEKYTDIKSADDDCNDVSLFISCVIVYIMLMAYGYHDYASRVLQSTIAALSLDDSLSIHTEYYIRNAKSIARKGKTNRHHNNALKIAMNTWDKYPNASLAGVTEEIHAYLRSKWNDTPAAETIKSWLKKSNLYPDAKPKNRDFKLVINEEGEI